MALEVNPFTQEGRRRRLTAPEPYSQVPAAAVNPDVFSQVANPAPVQEAVGSLPNQLQVDPRLGRQQLDEFTEGYGDWMDSGLGYLGLPTPMLTATSERDQTNGDYLNAGYDADWAGVPDWLRGMQEMYLEPVVGRENAGIAAMNAERARVREVAQPQSYTTQRPVQNIDPQTGRSFTTFVDTEEFQPFFPIESLFL